MKNIGTIGIVMLFAGIFFGIYAFQMDTSVAVDYQDGNSMGLPERINNLGLMADRQNYLIGSGILAVLGLLIYLYSESQLKTEAQAQKKEYEMQYHYKQCPQCAEKVKKEAKICRFCNYNFSQVTEKVSESTEQTSVNDPKVMEEMMKKISGKNY